MMSPAEPAISLVFIWFAVAVNVALFLAALGRVDSRLRRQEHEVAALQRELRNLSTRLAERAVRLEGVEHRLERLAAAQQPLERERNVVFDHAIRLVRQGVGADKLVSSCGLSRNEARLVELLHGAPGPSRDGESLCQVRTPQEAMHTADTRENKTIFSRPALVRGRGA